MSRIYFAPELSLEHYALWYGNTCSYWVHLCWKQRDPHCFSSFFQKHMTFNIRRAQDSIYEAHFFPFMGSGEAVTGLHSWKHGKHEGTTLIHWFSSVYKTLQRSFSKFITNWMQSWLVCCWKPASYSGISTMGWVCVCVWVLVCDAHVNVGHGGILSVLQEAARSRPPLFLPKMLSQVFGGSSAGHPHVCLCVVMGSTKASYL